MGYLSVEQQFDVSGEAVYVSVDGVGINWSVGLGKRYS